MELINSIEIKYFRSIYNLTLKDIRSLNVFSGRNDAGKSNILKALNLFFNNQTEYETPIDFYKDFSLKRLSEVRRDTIKGRQFISIKITFKRGKRCENTLPEKFTVTKKWYRDSKVPDVTDDLIQRLAWSGKTSSRDLTLAKTSLTRFLNSLRYIYVPAIKDQIVFSKLLNNLQDVVFEGNFVQTSGLPEQLKSLNDAIVGLVQELSYEFQQATGIQSSLSLPTTLRELYKAFFIHTQYGHENQFKVPLDQRGDGIRVRYIPSILHYITTLSRNTFIWGFEEPENSLEYSLCNKMADDFYNIYSKPAQIFVTSHSPAFFSLEGDSVVIKRIGQVGFETKEVPFSDNQDFIDELGFTELQKEIHQRLKEKLNSIEKVKTQVRELEQSLRDIQVPVILTEGKTDKIILETAWKKLYPNSTIPFKIESCDVVASDDPSGGSGGYETLRKSLEVVRPSNPHIIIGLFDADKAGLQDGFEKLSKNFSLVDLFSKVKVHKNKKSIALALPIPPGKEKFAKYLNLPLEFYFDEEALNTRMSKILCKWLNLPIKKELTIYARQTSPAGPGIGQRL